MKPSKKQEQRVERLYGKHCYGLRINIMDIGKVFKEAEHIIASDPAITDDNLGSSIRAYVETIARD